MSDFLERIAKLSPKRLALLAMELNSKLGRLEQRSTEPIAVTGIGCRFPGGANDSDSFWRLLIEGRDAISQVPPERWDIDALYDADPDAPGKMSTRWGGFLSGVGQFDPEFFGISPREAVGMDPQQRLLLEVVWEALENAGQNPDGLSGSQTGVFVGLCNSDYYLMQFEGGRVILDAYVATGNAHSVASGRISYILGLQGPSVSVDTGCSASLVAVHLACQSLRAGECRMALAGGVNLILMPDTTVVLSKARMMSPDGRCKSFDAAADGFVRSEGCGVVVLKRLSNARADGDRILGVIRGTASNQDGRSNGLTAPNGPSQVAVIRAALANAGLQPGDIDYIEAHGTGTPLGDPIEARSLAEVFCRGRAPELPLRVGSVKSNFGHAESAAGIAGLIKVLLAMQHEIIPPSLHLKKMNPHIDWSGLAIGVPTAPTLWNRKRGLRTAGVSSFGFSGTNAHVTVSDHPSQEHFSDASAQSLVNLDAKPPLQLLPLSGRTEQAVTELAQKYLQLFSEKPDLALADVCHTAGIGRSHFDYRLAIIAADLPEAKNRLAAFRWSEKRPRIYSGHATKSILPGVVFVFTDQGSQYPGMGRELYETQPVFRRELEKCAEILKPLLDQSILEVFFGGGAESNGETRSPHLLDETQYTQPALFVLEYALAAMWRSWGVEPVTVLGEGVGEYVAACVAGVFSLEDGLHLIAERGRLVAKLPPGGIQYSEPLVDIVSNLTGKMASPGLMTSPEYWRRHIRNPVPFADSIRALREKGRSVFLEIGPHPFLGDRAHRTAPQTEVVWAASLKRDVGNWESLLDSASTLYVHGVELDWTGLHAAGRGKRIALPTYPFQRGQYWLERRSAPMPQRTGGFGFRDGENHPLLGRRLDSPAIAGTVFEIEIGVERPPSFEDHRIFGHLLMPLPAYLEMALAGATETAKLEKSEAVCYEVTDLIIREPLFLSEDDSFLIQVILEESAQPSMGFRVCSGQPSALTGTLWRTHAGGRVSLSKVPPQSDTETWKHEEVWTRCSEEIDPPSFYHLLSQHGLAFGDRLHRLVRVRRGDGEALAEFRLPESLDHGREAYRTLPTLLDCGSQLLYAALPTDSRDNAYLPICLKRSTLFAVPSEKLWSHAVLRPLSGSDSENFSGDIWFYDEQNRMVAEFVGLQLGRITPAAIPGPRPPTRSGSSSSKKSGTDSEVSLQLKSASPARRHSILIAHLRSLVGNILGFDPSREIELQQGLFDMGLDSLMAAELKERLQQSLGVPLPATLTFNYPTIEALVDYVLSDALDFDSAATQKETSPIPEPAQVLSQDYPSDDLSEDELSALLMKKLEGME